MPGVTTSFQTGVHASRPANGAGCVLYDCTTHGLIYRDDGTTWTTFATLGTAGAYTPGGTDVAVSDGGTGASTAGAARTNLGLVIGTDVQAWDADLDSLASVGLTAAGLALLDDASAAAQRTTLGLGTAATQATGAFDASGAATAVKGLPLGLTGAVSATRYVGATAAVAPTTGTFAVGDFVITQAGSIYICTAAGTPGTWAAVSGGGGGTLTVETVSGSPTDSAVTKIVFPNGTLGIAAHVATYTPAGGGGSATPEVNAGGRIYSYLNFR